MSRPKTAVVFSAGGMFGAWQAGAWRIFEPVFRPDLVVGASIGALNGWAVAGGAGAAELQELWTSLSGMSRLRLRIPRHVLGGWIDPHHFEAAIADLHARYKPRIEYAVVITDLLKLKPSFVAGPSVGLDHLLASCALPMILDQKRIGGRIYTDGGLMKSLPLWAAVELGATRIVALNALPRLPFTPLRLANRALRGISGWNGRRTAPGVEVIRLAPQRDLGSIHAMIQWRRDRIQDWIRQGEEDAKSYLAANKTFLSEMF